MRWGNILISNKFRATVLKINASSHSEKNLKSI